MDIVWTRWLVYLLLGIPLLVWFLSTRNNAHRVIVVLAVQLFVQGVFSFRRTVIGISIGPSIVVTYMALIGVFLQRRHFPPLGSGVLFWPAFLLFALLGVAIGSSSGALLLLNMRSFQEVYLEGLIFFLLGALAFEKEDEWGSFWPAFCLVVVGGLAASHLAMLATGWRPVETFDVLNRGDQIGGVFYNPNSLAHFMAWGIPVVLLQLLQGRSSLIVRAGYLGVLVLAFGSLILTGSRGGPLLLLPLTALVLALSGIRVGYLVSGVAALILVGVGAGAVLIFVFPEILGATLDQWSREGLYSGRLATAEHYLTMIIRNPLGVGLAPMNIVMTGSAHGFALSSAHNIYIDFMLKMGVLGLVCFLGLVLPVYARVVRAIFAVRGHADKLALLSIFALLTGFLISSFVEPLYDNGEKMNHVFWLVVGIGSTTALRVLAERRQGTRLPTPSMWTGAPVEPVAREAS